MIGLFSFLPALVQRTLGLSVMDTAWLILLWSGLSFLVALQARRLAGRVPPRLQLALGFVLHAAGALAMLGAIDAGSWTRLLPGLVVGGTGSGLLNAALPLLAVESVPAQRAAMGSGTQTTFRYIGCCAGVALTIALATSTGRGLAHGADIAMAVSAGLALLAAVGVGIARSGLSAMNGPRRHHDRRLPEPGVARHRDGHNQPTAAGCAVRGGRGRARQVPAEAP